MEFYPTPTSWYEKVLAARAAAEVGPSSAELRNAPLINCWFVMASARNNLTLCGIGSGHPRIRDGFITTSQLIALNPSGGWARSGSRWYRLGTSLTDIQAAEDRSPWDLVQISTAHYWQASSPLFAKVDDLAVISELIEEFIRRTRVALEERRSRQGNGAPS